MVPSDARPPFLIQRQPMARTALESLVFHSDHLTEPQSEGTQQALDALLDAPETLPSKEVYLFAQYIISLYVNALLSMQTAQIIQTLLTKAQLELRDAYAANLIKDPTWRSLLRTEAATGQLGDPTTISQLTAIGQRLAVEQHYPGSGGLIELVRALYSTRPTVLPAVQLYAVQLLPLTDYQDPTLVLRPTQSLPLNTTGFERTPDLGWKLLFSTYHQQSLAKGLVEGGISNILFGVASLALPLDPIELTDSLTQAMRYDAKAGIPFRNYLAMYLRQLQFRFDYQLSRLADNRRQLMRRLHAFCGVGAVGVNSPTDALFFLRSLMDKLTLDGDGYPTNASVDESAQLRTLLSVVRNEIPDRPRLTARLSYETAVEAAKAKPAKNPVDLETDPPSPAKVPAVPVSDGTPATPASPDDPDAFADDPEQLSTDTDSPESNNDNIEPTNPSGSAPVNTVNSIIPLALPGETTDDHLLRLMLLHYVNTAKRDANPDITAETLLALDYWCQNWLFLASIDVTKKLLTKFNLTAKLKELVA